MKFTRRNTLPLLHDHSKWCIWNRACTGGWRLWECEWKLLHPKPTEQSPKSLPFLHGGWFLLRFNKLWSITYTSRAACRAITPTDTDAHSPHTLLPGVHQLWWWEPYKIQWMMQPFFQCWCQKSNPQGSRCFIFSTPWLVSPHHTHHGPIPKWSMGWC